MLRLTAVIVLLVWQEASQAQLIGGTLPPAGSLEVVLAADVPPALGDGATLRFKALHMAYDGGSYGAHFKLGNGELVLFFPNPLYWSPRAKRDSLQPVAIESKKGLVEIRRGSALEARLVELLADDLADGQRSREDTLTLIRIRDTVLLRYPLREMGRRFDPRTWELTAEESPFGEDGPFEGREVTEREGNAGKQPAEKRGSR